MARLHDRTSRRTSCGLVHQRGGKPVHLPMLPFDGGEGGMAAQPLGGLVVVPEPEGTPPVGICRHSSRIDRQPADESAGERLIPFHVRTDRMVELFEHGLQFTSGDSVHDHPPG